MLAARGGAAPSASSADAPARESWPSCTHTTGAYRVEHPPAWANDAGILPACTLFDPRPVVLQPATEIPFTGPWC